MSRILLYDEGAQSGTELGGGQFARLSLMESLSDEFDPVLLTSADGELASEARERGIEVIIRNITADLPRFKRTDIPTEPITIARFVAGIFTAARRLGSVLDTVEPEILHPNENLSRLISILATFRRDTATVTHIDNEWSTGPFDPLMRKLYIYTFDVLIAVSDAVGDLVRTGGTRADNVVTVYPGIELSRFENVGTPEPPFPNTDGKTTITTVGSLIPVKGHEYLFQSLRDMDTEDTICLVVGTGSRQSELEHMVKEFQLEGTVRFLGYRSDVPEIYSVTDVAVTPSVSEAFPRVVLEAMASGVPVVASDVGGIGEAVIDGETGLLVPPRNPAALGEALNRMIESDQIRESFGQRGYDRVRSQFTFRDGAAQVESIYRSLCGTTDSDDS